VAKARKKSKSAFCEAVGAIWWQKHKNIQNQTSGCLLRPFGDLGMETFKMDASLGHLVIKGREGTNIFKISLLEAFRRHLVAKARKYSKSIFCKSPGYILRPREMLNISLLRDSLDYSVAKARNRSKSTPGLIW